MSPTAKPCVGLIAEDAELRQAFRLLMKSAGLTPAVYASLIDFLDTYAQKNILCVILDVPKPGLSGLETLTALRARHAHLPTLVLVGPTDVALAVQAMRNGAFDVLARPYRDEDLLARLHQAAAVAERLKSFQVERQSIAERFAALTPRETEVVDLMVAGKKNRTIAQELGISNKTLDIHRSNILRKMQTKAVADLVRWRLMEKADPFRANPFV